MLKSNLRGIYRSTFLGDCIIQRISNISVPARACSSRCKQNFGLCFDIDGVLVRGHVPFEETKKAIDLIKDHTTGEFKVPVVFVTNALAVRELKAKQLTDWLGIKVHPNQVVGSQSALKMFQKFRKKHVLLVGQGPLKEICEKFSFHKTCSLEDVVSSYPLLDVGAHENRERVSEGGLQDKPFPPVEGILLMGEPKHWESPLQVIVDLLLTSGHPVRGRERGTTQTLPLVACNMDLQYMHQATSPRLGHGAFLLCLESLFKKLTGTELEYEAVVGKPSEVTMRYAEHRLVQTAHYLCIDQPLHTMYMIGDNADVDIVGANLYHHFITSSHTSDIPASRLPPTDSSLKPQTVQQMRGVLVRTGVSQSDSDSEASNHSHREFPITTQLRTPYFSADNVLGAVEQILREHDML